MRILLVNDLATPLGGAEIATHDFRDALRRAGHDARLLASSAGAGGGRGFADYACLGADNPLRGLLQVANPWALARLRAVLASFRPDVVHLKMFLTQLSPLVLIPLRRVPTLIHVVWYRAVCPTGTKMLPSGEVCRVAAGGACLSNRCLPFWKWLPTMVQLRLFERLRGAARRVVANSEATRRRLAEAGIAPVDVIWNGVPAAPARPPLDGPPLIAFAGRLVPAKGADVLVHAFARVAAARPEARLLVAGDGPEAPRLRRSIEAQGIRGRVEMAGHLEPGALARRLDRAWVQAVPSRWEEPFGIVAAEALMRGTAVVASGSGGLAELIEPGRTGLLVPPGDADALARALLEVLRDRAAAEAMGAAGRAFALARLGERVAVERFTDVYRAIAGERPRRVRPG